jgi:hypothetical protein
MNDDNNIYNNWQEYYDVIKFFYEYGTDQNGYDGHIQDRMYQQLLSRRFDPQEGLNGFIEASFVGNYAYEFMSDYINIIRTFIYYGDRINRQIFDLLFNRANQPMYLNNDLEEEYDEELEEELVNNYQMRAYIIDIIAILYNEDYRVLSIDKELYERLLYRRLFNFDMKLYNLLSQSDFSKYTANSLINIVIDYSENILPLIYYTYANWSLIYIVGDIDAIMALPNYNILPYDTVRFMLLKYYSGYLQSI